MIEFSSGEDVKLVVPFRTADGTLFKAGRTGCVFTFKHSLAESAASDEYEVGFDPDERGREPGILLLPSVLIERTSADRRPGELRQGDRVRLVADVEGRTRPHPAGQTATVLTRHIALDHIAHDVALDFDENVRVRRADLELIPGVTGQVTWSDDGSVRVNLEGAFPEREDNQPATDR